MGRRLVLGLLVVAAIAMGVMAFDRARPADATFESASSIVVTPPTAGVTAPAVTQPAWAEVRLAVAGDVGTGGDAAYLTASAMDQMEGTDEFDALLLLGDNVYEDGDPALMEEKVFAPFEGVLDGGTAVVGVLGNHDIVDGHAEEHAAALGMPDRWYSTEYGAATIIALDSNQTDNETQLRWLLSTLHGVRTPWTIVIMHHPAYSAGFHGDTPGVQQHFVPLFEEFDVDLVLSGHDHDYQRNRPINDVTYVVTGAAAKLRPAGENEFTALSASIHSFVELRVNGDRIEGSAVDQSGRIIDSFVLDHR